MGEAMAYLKQAVELDPRSAEMHNTFGNVLVGAGNLPEAISHYERAIQINPKVSPGLFQYGLCAPPQR